MPKAGFLLALLGLAVMEFGTTEASMFERLAESVVDSTSAAYSWILENLSIENEEVSSSTDIINLRWSEHHPKLCTACKPRKRHPVPPPAEGEECHCRVELNFDEQQYLNISSCTKVVQNVDPAEINVSSCDGTYQFVVDYKPSRKVVRKAQEKYESETTDSDK